MSQELSGAGVYWEAGFIGASWEPDAVGTTWAHWSQQVLEWARGLDLWGPAGSLRPWKLLGTMRVT